MTGTSRTTKPYKIGDKTADIMLEVLNLDKKETISIDGISNQEFSEVFDILFLVLFYFCYFFCF